jgi:hypothetical protein
MPGFVEEILLNLGGTAVDGRAKAGLDSTSDALVKIADKLAAFVTVGAAAAAIKGILDSTSAYEDMAITVAATMSATNGWTESLAIANDTLGRLKETAAVFGGSTQTMVDTFTTLKRVFGGTSDDAATLTDRLAALARQAGTTADTLAQRLAMAANSGTLMPRGAAGIALTGLGIDPKELQSMQAAGLAMDYLNAKIADNPALVAVLKSTWSYLGAEFDKTKNSAMELVGQGFEPLKQTLRDLETQMAGVSSQDAFARLRNDLSEFSALMAEISHPAVTGDGGGFATYFDFLLKILGTGLADLIFIGKELGQVMFLIWDMLTHPAEYLGSNDTLRAQLDDILKIYQDWQQKLVRIKFGVGANPLDADNPMASTPGGQTPTDPGAAKAQNDVAALQKASDEYQKIIDKINAMSLDGLSKKLATENVAIGVEITKLTAQLATVSKSATPDPALQSQLQKNITALTAKQGANADAINREAALAHTKRMDDQAKEQDEIYALSLTGYAKDMQAATAAHDQATLANEAVLEKSKNDAITNATLISDTHAKQLLDDQKFADAEILVVANASAASRELGLTTAAAFNVETLKANGDTYLSTLDTLAEQMRVEANKLGGQLLVNPDLDAAFSAKWKAIFDDAALTQAAATAGMTGDWDAYWAHEQIAIKNGTETWSEGLGKMATDQTKWAITVAQGMEAGWNQIQADAKTTGQVISTEMVSAWNAVTTGMTDALSNLMTGQGSLGSAFTTMFQGIEKSWAATVTGMVTDWLLGAKNIGNAGPDGPQVPGQRTGGLLGSDTGAYIGFATAAYTAGTAVAGDLGTNNQPVTYNGQTYDTNYGGTATIGPVLSATTAILAASAAYSIAAGIAITTGWSLVGLIAAAAVLLVGAILSVINGPAEGKIGFQGSSMAAGATGLGGAAYTTYSAEEGSLAGIMQAGGGTALSLQNSKFFNDPAAFISQLNLQFHAGNATDLTKDITDFFSTEMPKLLESYAFGQTQNGFLNSTTSAGSAGIEGIPSFVSGSFDPGAPIPAMLEGLGFTSAKITEIATQIDMRAPDDFAKYLENLLGVVVGFNAAKAQFSKSGATLWSDAVTAAAQTPQDQFATSAANLTTMANALSGLTGDAQVTAAQTLVTAYQAAMTAEQAYVASLVQAAQTFEAQATATITQFQGALARNAAIMGGANASDYDVATANNRLWGVGVTGIGADINSSTTLAQVQAFSAEAMTDINTLFNVWQSRASDALSLMQSFAAMDFNTGAAGSVANPDNSVAAWAAGAITLTNQVAAAGKLSGQAELDALHAVQTAAAARYQQELQFLQEIAANLTALHTSIGQQQADISLSLMTPAQQADYYKTHMAADYTALGNTTDPNEIARLTAEIQAMATSYYALFSSSDPSQGAAAAWLTNFLGQVDAAATAAYTRIGADITTAANIYGAAITAAQNASIGAWTDANTEIGKLSDYVAGLNTIVHDKLLQFATDASTAFAGLPAIIAETTTLFTDVNAALGGGGGSGGGGGGGKTLIPNLDTLSTSTANVGAAFDALTAKFNAWQGPGASASATGAAANIVAGALYANRAFGSRNYAATGI